MIAAVWIALVGVTLAQEEAVSYKPGDGIRFKAGNSGATGKLSLWAQPVVGLAVDEDGAIGRLEVRRARMNVVVMPKDWLRVELGISADRSEIGVLDAEVQLRLHDAFVVRAGRSKLPSGLERETGARNLALLERTAVADLVQRRAELVGIDGEHGAVFWRTAVARVDAAALPIGAPLAIDGAAGVGALTDHAGASVRVLVSPRPHGSLGAVLEDPSDGTKLADARPWEGLGVGGGADVGLAVGKARAVAEGAVTREGRDLATVSGHTLQLAGYALVGVGIGKDHERVGYRDSFATIKGFEALVRLDGCATWPAPGAAPRTTGLGAAIAGSYAPTKSMRVQLEGRSGLSWTDGQTPQTGVTVVAWLAVGP